MEGLYEIEGIVQINQISVDIKKEKNASILEKQPITYVIFEPNWYNYNFMCNLQQRGSEIVVSNDQYTF